MSKKGSTALLSQRELEAQETITRERAAIALALAAEQLAAEADAKPDALATITVVDEDDYEIVTAIRASVRASKDRAVVLRQAAAQPWKKVGTTIEDMFRPLIRSYETIEADLRAKLESYQLAKARAEAKARELATAAAQRDDSEALTAALTTSATLAVRSEGGRVALRWVVKKINPALVTDEWKCPDVARIEMVAKNHRGDEAPIIPGVTFEQTASVAVKSAT